MNVFFKVTAPDFARALKRIVETAGNGPGAAAGDPRETVSLAARARLRAAGSDDPAPEDER